MMLRYDPQAEPDREDWFLLDESEQIDLISQYHKHASIKLPNAHIHAVFHMIVEKQVADGDGIPVKRTVDRLVAEGLDRHDVIHAVGRLLLDQINEIVRKSDMQEEVDNNKYYSDLEKLTAENCRAEDNDQIDIQEREDFGRRMGDMKLMKTEQQPIRENFYRNVGRNDPCPCGSGKKFKKCCL